MRDAATLTRNEKQDSACGDSGETAIDAVVWTRKQDGEKKVL